MKKYLLLLVLIASISGFSQSVNDYQYVIVPTKFSIFKDNDKYRLNSATKLLLEKYGFTVFMSTDELPAEIGDNCKRLYADLGQDKQFMATKIKIVLRDCKERVVFETDFGKSREKDFATAYMQALRETTKSFDKLNYKYTGKNGMATEKTVVVAPTQVVTEAAPSPVPSSSASTSGNEVFYFAQPTTTGFQVIDNEPKVIMRLFNTSQKDVFTAIRGTTNGVLITKNGEWFFEYYENGKMVSERMKLKF
jgi:hypothetical protein